MEIGTNTTRNATATTGGQAQSGNEARTTLNSDFETFLTMLTVQLENQDPLNPMDSTEFATQLATFSSVEQQVLTNDLLTELGAQMGAQNMSQLANWVGMDATAAMPVNFTGDPVSIITQGDASADEARLVVRAEDGTEVARYDVETDRRETQWIGLDTNGAALAPGSYSLTVLSYVEGELIDENPVLVQGRIIEARNENGVPVVVMDSGQQVQSSDIVGLKRPAQTAAALEN